MSILKNILSFGASGRIDKKLEEFEEMRYELEELHSKMETRRVEVNTKLEQLINKKKNSIFVLKKIEKISANLKIKDRENLSFKVGNDIEKIDLQRIESTITTGEMAINSAKGIASGVGTALGAWALVGQLGVASTGTAISSLSGVALTNATLAWFGGGSLAVGGGGIAAGTAVIGGIVAVPILLVTGIFSHLSANKKISEIEAKMLEIAGIVDNIEGNILKMDLIGTRSDELLISLTKASDVYEIEIKKVLKKLYPIPFLSKILKKLRQAILRKPYFSRHDLEEISYIGKIATEFAAIIDTKILTD